MSAGVVFFCVVIFGASGDLTKRKLVPALYALAAEGSLPAGFTVVGAGRSEMTDEEFREEMRRGIEEYGRVRGRQRRLRREALFPQLVGRPATGEGGATLQPHRSTWFADEVCQGCARDGT